MSIWGIIKSLKYRQLKSAFFLFLKKPLFIYPTLKATVISYQISQREFPKTHQLNGKGNAFRHALWNMMISKECSKWTKNKNKAITWAKTITDWHEELSPNEPLDKAMDLHNNKVGRELFKKLNDKYSKLNSDILIDSLKEKLKSSVKTETIFEMDNYMEVLVYISELTE